MKINEGIQCVSTELDLLHRMCSATRVRPRYNGLPNLVAEGAEISRLH